ncbi:Diaminopimelate decarboxylase [Enhygromyxa salina]|uniref:Diaminopimelate decarboxylase n=1 Tax=Enhygromyxa salina TaxID=215803 RepID=A0A2S9XJ35_9BACT|nr:diaminopimelate decarboxylase [Enhygromyxa salina]PRP92888.1 Diaminopimelate decarboxylase [Enhygromyxa salina]
MSERRPDHLLVRDDPQRFGLRIVDDNLYMEDVDLRTIAAEVGTPVYVYGAAHIEQRYRGLVEALAARPTLICYAVKANSNQAVLRTLARLGAGADIVSGGELERALAAGIPGDKIVFSGVGKQPAEIDAALAAKVRSINLESAEELELVAERAAKLGVRAPVSLRINPDVDPDTHPYLATGLREAKFGIAMEQGLALALRAHEHPALELVGLACHIGSQIVDSAPFLDSLARMRELIDALAERGVKLRQLDLGGGLGIAYEGNDPVLEADRWGRALVDATADLDCELVLEPGRYLVGNAGVLLSRVVMRKQGETKKFVIVDAAMNDLLRPALYEAYHAIVPVELPAPDAALEPVDVVGPICECGDFLARERPIPWPARGELLAVLGAGAYGMAMASTYNTRPLASEVLVSGDRWAVVRPRRRVEELLGDERYPDWLS